MATNKTALPPTRSTTKSIEFTRLAHCQLRSLLAMVALICLIGGHYANRFHRRQQIEGLVNRYGGQIGYAEPHFGEPTTHPMNRFLLRDIEEVTLFFAATSDAELAALQHCRKLRRLNLAYATVGDEVLETISDLPTLNWLDLKQTQVSDEGLRSLVNQCSIESMILDGTAITDAGLATLSTLPTLSYLSVRKTDITPAGIEQFCRRRPTCVVSY